MTRLSQFKLTPKQKNDIANKRLVKLTQGQLESLVKKKKFEIVLRALTKGRVTRKQILKLKGQV